MKAEKLEGREWEIPNDQLRALLSRSLDSSTISETMATVVYSLDELKERYIENTLRMLTAQCLHKVEIVESGDRG